MSPVERSLVERKLGQIAERLAYLERYVREGWEPYRTQFERRKAAEKLLQEVIEAAIDVNTHLLVELGRGAPRDYHHSFTELGRQGWLPEDLVRGLAPAAGLRNRLVHQYTISPLWNTGSSAIPRDPDLTSILGRARQPVAERCVRYGVRLDRPRRAYIDCTINSSTGCSLS